MKQESSEVLQELLVNFQMYCPEPVGHICCIIRIGQMAAVSQFVTLTAHTVVLQKTGKHSGIVKGYQSEID